MPKKNTKIDLSRIDEQIRLRIESKAKGYITWGELAEEFGVSKQYLHRLINRELTRLNLIRIGFGGFAERPIILGEDIINK